MTTVLKQTALGTAIREPWNEWYYQRVIDVESETGRSICAAPKKDGDPCRGRPEEQHGHYCRLHKMSGELQLTAGNVKHPIKHVDSIPILQEDHIRLALQACDVCPVRRTCGKFMVGHYCRIEEQLVNRFMLMVETNYEIDEIDRFSVMQAALGYAAMFRGRVAQGKISPQEAEASRLSWMAPRESKEFVRVMKELGLTRKERIEQQKQRMGVAALPSNTTLAQIMSGMGTKEVKVTQSVTVKKEEDIDSDSVIDVEGDVVDG